MRCIGHQLHTCWSVANVSFGARIGPPWDATEPMRTAKDSRLGKSTLQQRRARYLHVSSKLWGPAFEKSRLARVVVIVSCTIASLLQDGIFFQGTAPLGAVALIDGDADGALTRDEIRA